MSARFELLTTDGGAESMCGWVKDRYGVSWQIAPMAAIERTINGPDAAGRQRAMTAMMQMMTDDLIAMASTSSTLDVIVSQPTMVIRQ